MPTLRRRRSYLSQLLCSGTRLQCLTPSTRSQTPAHSTPSYTVRSRAGIMHADLFVIWTRADGASPRSALPGRHLAGAAVARGHGEAVSLQAGPLPEHRHRLFGALTSLYPAPGDVAQLSARHDGHTSCSGTCHALRQYLNHLWRADDCQSRSPGKKGVGSCRRAHVSGQNSSCRVRLSLLSRQQLCADAAVTATTCKSHAVSRNLPRVSQVRNRDVFQGTAKSRLHIASEGVHLAASRRERLIHAMLLWDETRATLVYTTVTATGLNLFNVRQTRRIKPSPSL